MIRTGLRTLATLTTFLALALSGMGCGASKGKGELLAAGTLSATAAPATSGTAAGHGTSTVLPGLGGPDTLGPDLEVTSPARAGFTSDRKVRVEGRVVDLGSGVAEVPVAGRPAPLTADRFPLEGDLEPGLATILVEAWDLQGNRTERHTSLIVGELAAEADPLPRAAASRLDEAALDLLEPQVVADVAARKPQLVQQVLASRVDPDTRTTGFDFGPVTAGIDAVAGGLKVDLVFAGVRLDIEYSGRVLGVFRNTERGSIRAREVRVETIVDLAASGGRLQARLRESRATAVGLTVPDWARSEEAKIRRSVEQGFATSSGPALATALGAALQQQMAGQQTTASGGRSFTLAWQVTELACDADGMTCVLSANVTTAPVYGAQDRSLVTRGALPPLGRLQGAEAAVALHRDLLARSLHASWRAGAFRSTLDAAALARLAPGSGLALDTTALLTLAPELAAVLPAGVPLELEVEALLPPVLAPAAPGLPHPLELRLGDVRVVTRTVDPASGQRTLLSEAVYALRAEVAAVEQQGQVRLSVVGQVEVHADAHNPPFPGAEALLERLGAAQGPQLLGALLAGADGFPLPSAQGIGLQGVQAGVHGESLLLAGRAAAAGRP